MIVLSFSNNTTGATSGFVLVALPLDLRVMISPVVSYCIVCPFLIYGFCLPVWYLQTFFNENENLIRGDNHRNI